MKKNLKQKMTERGQTLIEVLVALTTAVLIVAAIVVVVLSSLNNEQLGKNQNLATQFAQEGIEVVNNLAQSNWNNFLTYTDIYYCLDQTNTLSSRGISCSPNVYQVSGSYIFVREVDIIPPGGASTTYCSSSCNNTTTVCTIVYWSDSKCTNSSNLYCHKVQVTSCIGNTAGVGAP